MDGLYIKAVEPFDSKRLRILTENGESFVLYKGEVRKLSLQEGSFIPPETESLIRNDILKKRATKRCLHLLEKRRYSERRLFDKLKNTGYDDRSVRAAIDYAKSFHYVDDDAFAYDYIEAKAGSISMGAIRTKLLGKGIAYDVIDSAIERFKDQLREDSDRSRSDEDVNGCIFPVDEVILDEGELIRSLLLKKHYNPDNADRKEKQRMYSYLARRGFSTEDILREMDRFSPDEGDSIVD